MSKRPRLIDLSMDVFQGMMTYPHEVFAMERSGSTPGDGGDATLVQSCLRR